MLEVSPAARFEIIDVRERLVRRNEQLEAYPRAVYCSFHTTAGYLDQRLAARLARGAIGTRPYIEIFRTLFPENAGYQHDELASRNDLTDDQRLIEPRNADAHLAFMAAGLHSCLVAETRSPTPVYFVELDGVSEQRTRRRKTSVIGFNNEEIVARERVTIPVSAHPLESISLKQPDFGLYERFQQVIDREGIAKGRIRISLAPGERDVGLTVNEYETLLMRHDLVDALRDPLKFVAERGRRLLEEPWAIPGMTLDHAKYDLVRGLNRTFDVLDLNESFLARIVSRLVAIPARRFLQMKRSVSLLISDREQPGRGAIAEGQYQCPILVHWRRAPNSYRVVDVTVSRLR